MPSINWLKKGTAIDMVLMETFTTVLVLGVVLLGMLYYVYQIGSETSYEKQYTASKQAISLEALQNLHYNAFIFDLVQFNFSYSYSAGTVKVFDEKGDKKAYFTEDKEIKLTPKELLFAKQTISPILIAKQGNHIIIDSPAINPDFKPNMNLLECPEIKTAQLKIITLDPGHGWNERLAQAGSSAPGDKGFVNEKIGLKESESSIRIAGLLSSLIRQGIGVKTRETRDLTSDQNIEISERLKLLEGDAVISIHTGDYKNKKMNPAKAYVNSNSLRKEESKKLGCLILNSLSNKLPELTSIAIVPVNMELLEVFDADSQKRVLLKDKVGVLLELGNAGIEQDNILLSKQKELAEAIYEGIKDYQG